MSTSENRNEQQINSRLFILLQLLGLWLLAVVGKLVYLQVISHDELARMANRQQMKTVEVHARRGTIFDSAGEPLAMSLPAPSVAINPLHINDKEVAASLLAATLHVDEAELLAKIRDCVNANRGFLWVKKKVTPEEEEALRSYHLDWVDWQTESQRFYPNQGLAAHVLGSVFNDQSGSGGIEQGLDSELTGSPGKQQVLTDVKGRPIYSRMITDPEPGFDVTLSINRQLQHMVEQELAEAVKANHVENGTVVVMRPGTGEILAMASYPTYNPNDAVKPGDDPESRFNRTVSFPFEPGSVFKVFTISAGIQEKKVRPETPINCGAGAYNFFGRVVHDTHSNGVLPVSMVLAKSSNIGAIQIGLRMGDETLLDYVRKFGFGKSTGVPLPSESPGLVRRLQHWTKTSIASVAMGQEISTTSLQLAQACSVIANGGYLVRPKLVLRKHRPGKNEDEPLPEAAPVRIISASTAATMRQMMEGVMLVGTGKGSQLKGYSSGGKTGTAQIFDLKHHVYLHKYNASFIGFAPLNKPAIVISVTLSPSALMAGAVAAPVFQKVAMESLRILDVPRDLPDDIKPTENPKPDPKLLLANYDSSDAGNSHSEPALVRAASGVDQRSFVSETVQIAGPVVPDLQGKTLRALLQQVSAMGLPVETRGHGVVRAQQPPPGTMLTPGIKIRVELAR